MLKRRQEIEVKINMGQSMRYRDGLRRGQAHVGLAAPSGSQTAGRCWLCGPVSLAPMKKSPLPFEVRPYISVLVFYSYTTNCHQCQSLKQHTFITSVPVGQESRCGLAGSSAQRLSPSETTLNQGVSQSCGLTQGSGSSSKLLQLWAEFFSLQL